MTVDLAYHWAPVARHKSIQRVGLRPGSRSRNGAWRPPFVCLSRDPAYAIESSLAQTPTSEPMDLWMVDLGALTFGREEFDWHDEVRVYERIPARQVTWIAVRPKEATHDRPPPPRVPRQRMPLRPPHDVALVRGVVLGCGCSVKRLIAPVVLALAFTFVPYVRRGLPKRPSTPAVVVGSRDRALAGKARRRARQAERCS